MKMKLTVRKKSKPTVVKKAKLRAGRKRPSRLRSRVAKRTLRSPSSAVRHIQGGYDQGFDRGYDKGYVEGFDKGFEEGFDDTYSAS